MSCRTGRGLRWQDPARCPGARLGRREAPPGQRVGVRAACGGEAAAQRSAQGVVNHGGLLSERQRRGRSLKPSRRGRARRYGRTRARAAVTIEECFESGKAKWASTSTRSAAGRGGIATSRWRSGRTPSSRSNGPRRCPRRDKKECERREALIPLPVPEVRQLLFWLRGYTPPQGGVPKRGNRLKSHEPSALGDLLAVRNHLRNAIWRRRPAAVRDGRAHFTNREPHASQIFQRHWQAFDKRRPVVWATYHAREEFSQAADLLHA